MVYIPVQQRKARFQIATWGYNPENINHDLEAYTEVKVKDDSVGSNKVAAIPEGKEKDLRTRMFGFLLGCLASLLLAVSAACVQVCILTKSDVVHNLIPKLTACANIIETF